jgi:hypothetical protein
VIPPLVVFSIYVEGGSTLSLPRLSRFVEGLLLLLDCRLKASAAAFLKGGSMFGCFFSSCGSLLKFAGNRDMGDSGGSVNK